MIASQLLETNTKLLEALKISNADFNSSSSESSVESETEKMHAAAKKLTNIAELKIPDFRAIPKSVQNISLKDSLKKWHIVNWKRVDHKLLCAK